MTNKKYTDKSLWKHKLLSWALKSIWNCSAARGSVSKIKTNASGFVLLDQHVRLGCFIMDLGSLKGHLLRCKLLSACQSALIKNVALRL